MDTPTDRPRDRPTDRRTGNRSHRDAKTHLKINRKKNKSNPVVSLDGAATQYRDLRVLSSNIYNVEKETFYDFDSSNTREKQ